MSRRRWFHLGGDTEAVAWEIEHHLTERVDELIAQGRSRADAEEEARRAFGDVARVCAEMQAEDRRRRLRERLRDAIDAFATDARQTLRRLRRSPGYATVVILVLGLAIGMNTALFSALQHALLRGMPYRDAERLVLFDLLLQPRAAAPIDTMPWSWPKYVEVRDALDEVATTAAFSAATVTLTGAGDAERIGVEYVSPGYFDVLGLRAAAGAAFGPEHETRGAAGVLMLTHEVWASRFGADPAIIGRTLTIDGVPLQVIGVAPRQFRGLSGGADIFIPIEGIATLRGPRRLELAWAHWLRVVGRLNAATTRAEAQARVELLGSVLTEVYPDPSGGGAHAVALTQLDDARVNRVTRLALTAVSVAAALLLLVACANVASLMMARTAARRTDFAVRAALGAGRRRLVRISLMEALAVAVAGGMLGIVLAWAGRRIVPAAVSYALDTSGTRGLQFVDAAELTLDGTVFAAAIVLTLMTGLMAGLLPAWSAARTDVAHDLRTGGRVARGGRDLAPGGRGLLVAAQLAVSTLLLAGAGLMGASFVRLSAVPVGFTNETVLSAGFSRGPGSSPEQDAVFERTLLERVRSLAGVRAAAIGVCAPLTQYCEVAGVYNVDDAARAEFGDMEGIAAYGVSADYFETLGTRIVHGRTIADEDATGPPVVVINETAARELFGGDAVGHRIAITHDLTEAQMAVIVGVAADVQYASLEEPIIPALYYSRGAVPQSYGTLFVHTEGDPMSVLGAVRSVIHDIDPTVPLTDVTSLANLQSRATARTRTVLWLLGAFAAAGLLLAALGLYGLVSSAVLRRTPEMGLRIALGASAGDVLRTVMRAPLLLALTGALSGLVAALATTRLAQSLLFGIEPGDPIVLAAAVATLLVVAVAAAAIPALRALRIDPADALRSS